MPDCHSCGKPCKDYLELALHISASKKGHRRGKRWAAKFLMVNKLSAQNRRKPMNGSTPLTEEQKEARKDTRRELSGETEIVQTYCLRCKRTTPQTLPIEYTRSPDAWRINGKIIKTCYACGGSGRVRSVI